MTKFDVGQHLLSIRLAATVYWCHTKQTKTSRDLDPAI